MPSSIRASGTTEMTVPVVASAKPATRTSVARDVVWLLWQDKLAFGSAILLLLVLLCTILGPWLLTDQARAVNLLARNAKPFSLDKGWLFILGADALGRSLLARIIVASQNTMLIAASAVVISTVIGGLLGLVAGYKGGWVSATLLRLADAIMSFPSMLLAVIVLFVFSPGVSNVILVLAVSRIPIFLRTVRAEVLELKERMFVTAALAMGAKTDRILLRHIAPMVMPTVINLAALEMAFVMLVESGLSFLGIGIQPPQVTWGLMVADGRNYLGSAWWLSFWPGLAIMAVTMALNLLSNWLRIVTDPVERWRFQTSAGAK
ncbi:ABC-type dipeptide/oligopeptide/nickel transport system, permease component [Neorhizobium galegae bv. orientalis]|uniref:ABC-type dipeptide/oligopeptide/nickel transport system, permease component n=2 Tax=Neorhizobium galegae TaxID=399 RepID=A0A068T1Z5_NEOGA|nr:ABC-type dipeptide/oligopeptide/nickel transport system, permease component [Neorhizobium galegae bv. orientalis str. HAMBI 540]CDZ53349.1 ABC-type dipeptide/oligopeptide/nickel transport system, permease component [Neorhizobium galegae bv. orientalis]